MHKYMFILGKNPHLSNAEIQAYFFQDQFRLIEANETFSVYETPNILNDVIAHLGGTIKIIKVEKTFDQNKNFIDEILEIVPAQTRGKYFGVSVYSKTGARKSDFKFLKKVCMKIKRKTGLKFMLPPPDRKGAELTHVEVIKKRLLEDSFELVIAFGNKIYIGMTEHVHDPFEFQKRDISRPQQRPIFSISPRLAKIMINLSGCKKNQRLLDPFCGIGTIIQEAILEGIDAFGIDKDKKTVEMAKKNLEWLDKEYNLGLVEVEKRIVEGYAEKASMYFGEDFDAIVTEPYLGPPLKSDVKIHEAKKILSDLKPLFVNSFGEFLNILKPGGKIVIVIPSIKTEGIFLDLDTSFLRGLKIKIEDIFLDFEHRHRTIRKIYKIKKFGD